MKTNHRFDFRILSLFAFLAFALASCEEKGPAEKAGEKIDEAAEEVADEVDDATN